MVKMDMAEVLSCSGGNMIIPSTGTGGRLGAKLEDDSGGTSPPALPPRPPPRPRNATDPISTSEMNLKRTRVKKYVFLCSVCGGLASLLGTLFLAVYLILRTYTSSLDYFETIPTYIPAAMLMVTGLSVMCLARRRNRYIFLIKLCGLCCLMCVGTCVLVTVTTTVVHMSRLQSLRECVYTLKTQTCTCYSVLLESASERTDEGSRYVFNATPDCEAIHGALYSCLRALFGLSVIGILVCIFCCMLVYQLLSHERKKMYWEQLELRCRYLYGQASNPVRNPGLPQTPGSQPTQHCACCQQFRYQQDILTWEPSDTRFWSGAQVGNLYSPNPVGEDCGETGNLPAASSGWSWRRLPWNRQVPPPSSDSHRSNSYHQPLNCSSPDSQYGFNCEQGRVATVSSGSASYTTIDPVPQGPSSGCQVYHWGPPPPYSDPNSPTRSVLCPPGPHHHHCQRAANYVNTSNGDGESAHADNESCRVLQLRIPSRRPDLPLSSSSSSSIKSAAIQNAGDPECGRHQRSCHRQEAKPIQRAEESGWRECSVSPRIKYLHNKLQNTSVNPSRKRTQEPSESEVYFADVSSCNVSVRNDSMSVYGETFENKIGERMPTVSDEAQEIHNEDTFNNKLHSSPSLEEKNSRLKMIHSPQEILRPENNVPSKEIAGFQRVPSKNEFSYQGIVLDGSEEDDPELVNFSQRQTSLRGRLPLYRSDINHKIKNDLEQELPEQMHKSQTEFPSPMSISSPSTISKDNGGVYTEAINSDNGSLDSVWSGYSPDLLAPDAQYEVIPEHRLVSSEDLNGNLNEGSANRSRLKLYLLNKKRQYPQVISENWSLNNSVSSEDQNFSDRQKCSGHHVNSPKSSDRPKDLLHKTLRPNEHCLADILNSPKSNYKSAKHEQVSNNPLLQNISERRRNEFPPVCDHKPESSEGGGGGGGGLYYSVTESDNMCDIANLNSFDCVSNEKSQPQPQSRNSHKVHDCHEMTNVPKVMERVKLSNSNFVNSLEPGDSSECFHLDSNCGCYNSSELQDGELNQVRPVNV